MSLLETERKINSRFRSVSRRMMNILESEIFAGKPIARVENSKGLKVVVDDIRLRIT